MCPIKVGVEVSQISLIPSLCRGFWQGSLKGSDFGVASGLGGGVEEGDSFKRRNFSIIILSESISLLCLAWIKAMAVKTTDATVLIIDCWREESMILELAMISSKRETVSGNLSASVSQKRL